MTWCYCFELCEVVQCEGEYVDMTIQTLHTKDRKIIVVNFAVEYSIVDLKKAVLQTNELEPLVRGTCENEVREWARTHDLSELLDSARLSATLCNRANKKLERHGIHVVDLMMTDMQPSHIVMICDTIERMGERFIQEIFHGTRIKKPEGLDPAGD